jgi:hypothetical protein
MKFSNGLFASSFLFFIPFSEGVSHASEGKRKRIKIIKMQINSN